jgi:FkbM family methyltransferase
MKELLKSTLASLGYRVQGTRYIPRQLLEPGLLRVLEFDDVVCRRMFNVGPEFTFIQVGAFDGLVQDPLRKYIPRCNWRGILVEPQARAAGKLRELYRGNDGIVVLQAALGAEARKRTLFTVDSETAPAWAGALASFDRSTILKHSDLIPGLELMIKEETVDCVPFDYVLERLSTKQLDLLQIDAEGADAYILSLFPFDRMLPAVVHWEVEHLTMEQREDCLGRLAAFGYRFAASGDQDMMAVQF